MSNEKQHKKVLNAFGRDARVIRRQSAQRVKKGQEPPVVEQTTETMSGLTKDQDDALDGAMQEQIKTAENARYTVITDDSMLTHLRGIESGAMREIGPGASLAHSMVQEAQKRRDTEIEGYRKQMIDDLEALDERYDGKAGRVTLARERVEYLSGAQSELEALQENPSSIDKNGAPRLIAYVGERRSRNLTNIIQVVERIIPLPQGLNAHAHIRMAFANADPLRRDLLEAKEQLRALEEERDKRHVEIARKFKGEEAKLNRRFDEGKESLRQVAAAIIDFLEGRAQTIDTKTVPTSLAEPVRQIQSLRAKRREREKESETLFSNLKVDVRLAYEATIDELAQLNAVRGAEWGQDRKEAAAEARGVFERWLGTYQMQRRRKNGDEPSENGTRGA